MYKRKLIPYKVLWSVSVHCLSVPHLVATAWTQRGHSVGTPTAIAPSLALPHPRLLDLRLPVPGPEHGTVLDLVVRHLSGYS